MNGADKINKVPLGLPIEKKKKSKKKINFKLNNNVFFLTSNVQKYENKVALNKKQFDYKKMFFFYIKFGNPVIFSTF